MPAICAAFPLGVKLDQIAAPSICAVNGVSVALVFQLALLVIVRKEYAENKLGVKTVPPAFEKLIAAHGINLTHNRTRLRLHGTRDAVIIIPPFYPDQIDYVASIHVVYPVAIDIWAFCSS